MELAPFVLVASGALSLFYFARQEERKGHCPWRILAMVPSFVALASGVIWLMSTVTV